MSAGTMCHRSYYPTSIAEIEINLQQNAGTNKTLPNKFPNICRKCYERRNRSSRIRSMGVWKINSCKRRGNSHYRGGCNWMVREFGYSCLWIFFKFYHSCLGTNRWSQSWSGINAWKRSDEDVQGRDGGDVVCF